MSRESDQGPSDARRGGGPTLLDVARAVGVSRTTVSNAFNRPDQLSPGLRDKVLAAARRLGYGGPNPAARMLRTGRAGAIGLVFDESLPYAFNDPTAIAFLRGVAQACEGQDAGLLILPMGEEERAVEAVQAAVVDGFLLYCTPSDNAVIDAVRGRGLPVVAVDLPNVRGLAEVTVDDRVAAAEAAHHLLALGHRRFAILSMELQDDGREGPVDAQRRQGATFGVSGERLGGYLDALAGAGIDAGAVPVLEIAGNRPDRAAAATAGLLSGASAPTAILAMSDQLALGALSAARDAGVAVPGALSIIGFDDMPLAAIADPPLTTVRQPLMDKGRIAADLLFKRPDAPARTTLPTELVVRASTGPVPG